MIVKNDDGMFNLVCDFCEDTQAEISGDESFSSFGDAIAYKRENRHLWKSVKDRRVADPRDGWSDLCHSCAKDPDIFATFSGRKE